MNLGKKKKLAARTFGVGKERIVFVNSRLEEIKEAITKNDIRDLHETGAILIKEIKGRKTRKSKSKRRSVGNVRKTRKNRKRNYVILTRKLRGHVRGMKEQGKISKENFRMIRKKIRNKEFKSKANLKEYLGEIKFQEKNKWK